MKPVVRVAKNADGPRIGELGQAQGFPIEGLDWSDIEPYWLVAESEGIVVGAIQLCLAKPFGWLEMLFIDRTLTQQGQAKVMKALVGRGLVSIAAFGAQLALGTVSSSQPAWRRILKRRGGVVLQSGSLLAKRLS